MVESQSSSGASGSTALEAGKRYVIEVEGTFSYWTPVLWGMGTPCGTPEPAPMFPSGGVSGPVGADAIWLFAAHGAEPLCTSIPLARTTVEFNTGSGFTAPVPAQSSYSPEHVYEFVVIGDGVPLSVRVGDGVHSDNYGALVVRVFDPELVPGRILAAHDVNTLSASVAGPEELSYAVNAARWVVGEAEGRVLALESSPGSPSRNYSSSVKDAWEQAGYQVDYTQQTDWTLAELLRYDAVFGGWTFPSGDFFDADTLRQFVLMGGGVFVFGGVGNNPTGEAQALNPFLSSFGMEFETSYNGLNGSSVCSSHPVMESVDQLGAGNGQSLVATGTGANWRVLATSGNDLLYVARSGANDDLGHVYCTGLPNSTGLDAKIVGVGFAEVQRNEVFVGVTQLPQNTVGYFLVSRLPGSMSLPGSGLLCLGGDIGRYSGDVQDSGAAGCMGRSIDLTAIPTPSTGFVAANVGETWRFQAWFRDGASSNLSGALEIEVQ